METLSLSTMTPQQIIDKWKALGETLNPLTAATIDTYGLKEETKEFLRVCGFPDQSAPFLSFVKNSEHITETITRLSDMYDLPNEFEKYIKIGSDGSGNPIVINTANNDRVELLDHEQDFELLDIMNNDVYALSSALIDYNTFIKTILKENGEDAFLDANFSDTQFDTLKNSLIIRDEYAAKRGFWKMELDILLANRNHYRNEK
jgi:hypothetical protein